MKLTRVDTATLRAAVQQARAAIDQIRNALEPVLVTDLTEQDRMEVVRAPTRLPDAGRDLAALATRWPELMAATGYDPDAVIEDLENLELLSGLAETFADLTKWVEDSKLVWRGEAYFQSLKLYNVAKALEKTDGSLRSLVQPLEQVFAARRRGGHGPAPNALPDDTVEVSAVPEA